MEFAPPLIVGKPHASKDRLSMHGWDELTEFAPLNPLPAKPAPRQAQILAQAAARLLAETLTGHRSIKQLSDWLSPDERERLNSWIRAHRGQQVLLSRLKLVETAPGRVDGQLHFVCGQVQLCATICLVLDDGRWTCRHLNPLLPGTAPHL